MSKSNSARPYNIPSNAPCHMFNVKNMTYKFYKEWNEYTMFQIRDDHIQRVKLTEDQWYGMISTVRNLAAHS